MLLPLCDVSARHRSPLATTELSRRTSPNAPLRPREPPGGAERIVAAASGPSMLTAAEAAVILLPGVTPVPLWHAAAGVEGLPVVEHGGGHAGELILML